MSLQSVMDFFNGGGKSQYERTSNGNDFANRNGKQMRVNTSSATALRKTQSETLKLYPTKKSYSSVPTVVESTKKSTSLKNTMLKHQSTPMRTQQRRVSRDHGTNTSENFEEVDLDSAYTYQPDDCEAEQNSELRYWERQLRRPSRRRRTPARSLTQPEEDHEPIERRSSITIQNIKKSEPVMETSEKIFHEEHIPGNMNTDLDTHVVQVFDLKTFVGAVDVQMPVNVKASETSTNASPVSHDDDEHTCFDIVLEENRNDETVFDTTFSDSPYGVDEESETLWDTLTIETCRQTEKSLPTIVPQLQIVCSSVVDANDAQASSVFDEINSPFVEVFAAPVFDDIPSPVYEPVTFSLCEDMIPEPLVGGSCIISKVCKNDGIGKVETDFEGELSICTKTESLKMNVSESLIDEDSNTSCEVLERDFIRRVTSDLEDSEITSSKLFSVTESPMDLPEPLIPDPSCLLNSDICEKTDSEMDASLDVSAISLVSHSASDMQDIDFEEKCDELTSPLSIRSKSDGNEANMVERSISVSKETRQNTATKIVTRGDKNRIFLHEHSKSRRPSGSQNVNNVLAHVRMKLNQYTLQKQQSSCETKVDDY